MKPIKRKIRLVEDFDPRPREFRGSTKSQLPKLLRQLRGEKLCVSLLLDPQCRRVNLEELQQPTSCNLPDVTSEEHH